jgi:type III pantothenate kinase
VLLAVDVGNTLTHLGVFDRDRLVHEWRAATDQRRTADELALMFGEFLGLVDLSFSRQITGVAIASVVPRVTQELREMTERYFGFVPVVVEPGVKTGIAVKTDNPREVGADRIANSVAAHELFPGEAAIVVDFGTAINFDVVTEEGEYIGGALAPGLDSSATALFSATARLPRVELVAPSSVIGRNTVAAVQSGIIFGAAGLVDGLVERIVKELGMDARVVATGGLAELVIRNCHSVERVEPNLTLMGLRLIFERNFEADV